MNKRDEQQIRNAASMALLERMGKLCDEILQEREERRDLETDWRERCVKPNKEETE